MIRRQQIGRERARQSSSEAHCVENSRLALRLPMAVQSFVLRPSELPSLIAELVQLALVERVRLPSL